MISAAGRQSDSFGRDGRFFFYRRSTPPPPSLALLCHLPILHLIRSCEFVLSVGRWKLRRCETKECCYESGRGDGCRKVVQSREFGLNQFEMKEGRNLSGNTFVTILSSHVS